MNQFVSYGAQIFLVLISPVFPVLHFWSDRCWSLCSCVVWYSNYGCCLVLSIGCSADFILHWNSQLASSQPVLRFFLASHFLVSTLVAAQDLRFWPYSSLTICSSILPLKPLSSPPENRPRPRTCVLWARFDFSLRFGLTLAAWFSSLSSLLVQWSIWAFLLGVRQRESFCCPALLHHCLPVLVSLGVKAAGLFHCLHLVVAHGLLLDSIWGTNFVKVDCATVFPLSASRSTSSLFFL
jgi:hypothetical protein